MQLLGGKESSGICLNEESLYSYGMTSSIGVLVLAIVGLKRMHLFNATYKPRSSRPPSFQRRATDAKLTTLQCRGGGISSIEDGKRISI